MNRLISGRNREWVPANRTGKFNTRPGPHRQRGAVMLIVTAGMLGLLGMAGLAMDTGHLALNQSRLQLAVDAAALSAAKTLELDRGRQRDATTAAQAVVAANLSAELRAANPNIKVTFSNDLSPGSFQPTVSNPRYIKVAANAVPLNSLLVQLLGVNNKQISASAVAGFAPLGETCDLIPVMVCNKQGDLDDHHDDGLFFGYRPPSSDPNASPIEVLLKRGSGPGTGPDPQLGHGHFRLIELPNAHGGGEIRDAMAGGGVCGNLNQTQMIELQSGNKSGPTRQGINTRFGIYEGSMDASDRGRYPPDPVATTGISIGRYNQVYSSRSYDEATAGFHRRVVMLPIGNCDAQSSDGDFVPLLALACFFLLEPSSDGSIRGEFIGGCRGNGKLSNTPSNSSGPARITLYKDPDRTGS